jgi:rSAM/selenodomain-associated transferase 1
VTRIVIFAKAPVAGRVKTRLIPALGAEGAAALAREMLARTVEEALATGLAVELCGDPDAAAWHEARSGLALTAQGEGSLGERLAGAASRVLEEESLLLIGADCPDLDRRRLGEAAAALDEREAVIYPAQDGGYVLLGLRRFDPSLFEGISWSSAGVAEQTIARIEGLDWSLQLGEALRDVDEPEDLPRHAGLDPASMNTDRARLPRPVFVDPGSSPG